MSLDGSAPRVTLGIATYNRDTYLREAVQSCLGQDFTDLEVLVVLDGSTNPAIDEVLAGFGEDPRLRVVRHPHNRGIAAGYNTIIAKGRGELIAMLGDDDVSLPGRIRRQVEIFDRFPNTGVVHGDAVVIDAAGAKTGGWNSADFGPGALVRTFYRKHNYLIDPTRMVHRRVYEHVGGYDGRFLVAQDFEFWLRAARHFRFRHCSGGPLIALRRHGDNGSSEANRDAEAREVSLALEEALERYTLRELVPELDWPVLEPAQAERQALLRLAQAVEARAVPTPTLARRLRERAQTIPSASPRPQHPSRPAPKKLLMTMYGWDDSGGGTLLPRLAAKELVRRGWEVTVFHAATANIPNAGPYAIRETEADGVRLVGVHNRPHGLFDLGNPRREIDDPEIRVAFRRELERTRPDVVHFHNLHNLGASLIDEAAAAGVPAHFTTHNYWLVCARAYLMDRSGKICPGPGDGARCATCVGSADVEGHQFRLSEIRAKVIRGLRSVHAISDSVRRTLLACGYPAEQIDVVRQATPSVQEIWEQVGADRAPGRRTGQLTVAFVGSVYPHKGPQLLVQAAQLTQQPVRVQIHGEVPQQFAAQLRALDHRGVVQLTGAFSPTELPGLLAEADVAALPSTMWDGANLAAEECHAARLPLVVPRLGGLAETVRHEADGLTFTPLDAGDLARQLDRLAGETGLLERLQREIEPPPSFAAYVDDLEAYYAGERPGAVAGAPAPQTCAVRWKGDHGLPTSLSIINDRVTERLPGHVQRVERSGAERDAPLPHAADVEVRHQWPPDLTFPPAGRLAVILPWEFGAVPREWLSQVEEHVDELWVPSEHVRRMYLEGGLAPERVVTIPNGVDLDRFHPEGDALELPQAEGRTRFLFVGGLVGRKGPDVLLDAWRAAFAERDDVVLVVKDFGADSVYRSSPQREVIKAHAESGELPRVIAVDEKLSTEQLASLYRACDVLVHPYRGEGFAMPVLEAMASGLPVITTAGGPTDEFCPPEAGWRIRAGRVNFPRDQVDTLETAGRPWMLEPDRGHLVELLRIAAADAQERARRGAAGRIAAHRLSWDAVAARYTERIAALAARMPRLAGPTDPEPFPLTEDVSLRLLATPAWRGEDRLGELLAQWSAATTRTTSACLYLLSDPTTDGTPEELEARVLGAAAASGADIENCADINVLMEPTQPERDIRLHTAVDGYVPLHAACAGHERMALRAGNEVLALGSDALGRRLAIAAQPQTQAA